jgi:hypothetical protein
MTLCCKLFIRILMLALGILRFVSFSIKCSCIAPLTPAVMVMRGVGFHPLFCMVLISGSYLVCFCVLACSGNRSWQYVKSMSWIVVVGEGAIGVWVWFEGPIAHRTYGLSLVWQLQGKCGHAHLRSQYGIVLVGGLVVDFTYVS